MHATKGIACCQTVFDCEVSFDTKHCACRHSPSNSVSPKVVITDGVRLLSNSMCVCFLSRFSMPYIYIASDIIHCSLVVNNSVAHLLKEIKLD